MKLVYYPFLVNINGKRLLFIGGGQVAERKIKSLLPMAPSIRVIATRISEALRALAAAGTIEIVEREAQESDLESCDFAFLCTDQRECNGRFAKRAKWLRIPVNIADDPDSSDFHLPAVHIDKEASVVISVSTQGKSPSLARKLRDQLRDYMQNVL